METITRSGRAVQGFALGDVGRGGGHGGGGSPHGGHPGGGYGHGALRPAHPWGSAYQGVPGGWGWWGTPYDPTVEIQSTGPCAGWSAPIVMPPGMYMAARMALGASNFQPTMARGPDGILYNFSVDGSEIVVRQCTSQLGLGEGPSMGLAGVSVSMSPAFASLMVGATAGLLAHVLHAPFWGALTVGVGAALVTNVGIDKAA
jgi:hypothetical protein